MQAVVYDNTFAGLLTAIFEVYEHKLANVNIMPANQRQDSLFNETFTVDTDDAKAARVLKGLKERLSADGFKAFCNTFLSEETGMENKMLHYAQYAFSVANADKDYSHPAVLYIKNTAKKVHREKHRMEAFVRFQQTGDGLYYAIVDPDFNVLPLIERHFKKRYADQRWLIYDSRRKYGLYYNLDNTTIVTVDFNDAGGNTKDIATVLDDKEVLYQQLWQNYFASTNIKARKNMKLHIRHMPKRYWKYLTEKQLM
ncbi:MAG: TIGR03915 family putative DNA repair protein [Sphingobacteriales bacterium JAD_PAG50586_3]|nr:MAG: TIGR03915 family putative DNA repair protein [Sphingobacteriales bacterium JAD_PAG50586_3]